MYPLVLKLKLRSKTEDKTPKTHTSKRDNKEFPKSRARIHPLLSLTDTGETHLYLPCVPHNRLKNNFVFGDFKKTEYLLCWDYLKKNNHKTA